MYLGKFHVPPGKRKWGGGQQFLRNWPKMHQVDYVDAHKFHKTKRGVFKIHTGLCNASHKYMYMSDSY